MNISNHPFFKWSTSQLVAAGNLGKYIRDVPFPQVPATASHDDIEELVQEIILDEFSGLALPQTVMVQGEMTLTYALINALKERGHVVVAACSERNTVENADGTKTVRFQFVQFREY